ncbi:hemin-binding periplasmic protein [Thioalkalivibrio nitratireducens DSM 14787]|uniref:Hemin-binding periplasmic protein n=1 Tax=Thioalkalivibrio nitratireducens (strain DSM 14787 / UNIQEM 213 / ALEN2) TaxID=1255043 RepID=L0DTH5_THIND|nr:ABC transporter substrate-binding protein [Thioalkalivibrio nitratireducens]AGA32300.1 hemin-binding periplasmic protein [Thioalkalivibrio nitratireducens DSM 14787]
MNATRRRVLLGGLLSLCGVAAPGALATDRSARLISVGGSVTETVFAVGAAEQLVGVDTSSIFPDATRALPQVGYQRVLSAEGILSLAPTLLLADEQAGPAQVIAQIRAAGLPVDIVPSAGSPKEIARRILAIGRSVDRADAAQHLAERVAHRLHGVERLLIHLEDRPRVLLLLAHGRGSPLAAGQDTQGEAMIRMAGGHNALNGFRGYKPVSPEAIVAAAPEVVVLPEQSVQALGGIDTALATSGLAATPAVRQGRIVVLDMLYLLGMGPRTGDAVTELALAFHPILRAELTA